MKISTNCSLKTYNTFGIDVNARYFSVLHHNSEVEAFIRLIYKEEYKGLPLLILGGGSNILFTRDYPGIVAKIETKGIEEIGCDNTSTYIKAAAGEDWDGFVRYCIDRNLSGIENLALIPGKVGSSPIQNIGAYGVELKDVFLELEAIDIRSGKKRIFSHSECSFGYRQSIFKNKFKNRYIVLSVTFAFPHKHNYKTNYGSINEVIQKQENKELSPKSIYQAINSIRNSKIPSTDTIGSAGSFFKNPIIDGRAANNIKKAYPDAVLYPLPSGRYKVGAGWLIESCGWKGKRFEDIGVYPEQALILVNYGNGSGKDLYELSVEIQKSVLRKFEINLQAEVMIL